MNKYILSSEIAIHKVDFIPNGIFALNVNSGRIFRINETALWLLEKLKEAHSIDELIRDLTNSYKVEEKSATEDITCILKDFEVKQIISKLP